MLRIYTFFSKKNNDVLYAVAFSYEEAWHIIKEKLIGDDKDEESYIVGTSTPCVVGQYNSVTIS